MNSSHQDRRSAGWVSTLVALVVLVVVGFLCGALAGFLWEEPSLVLAYLSGKTEPVEWSGSAEPAPVAAAPPSYAENAELAADTAPKLDAVDAPPGEPEAAEVKPATPAPAPAPALAKPEPVVEKKPVAPAPTPTARPAPAKPAPAKVAAATTPAAGRFSVQVGAFADRASADKLVARLKGRGYTTYVKADGEGSMKRFRVRVGPVNGRPHAEELVAKLKGEKLSGWIVDESKG